MLGRLTEMIKPGLDTSWGLGPAFYLPVIDAMLMADVREQLDNVNNSVS